MDEQVQKQEKKRRGCFFYGCLTGVVFLLLILLGFLAGLKKIRSDFTEDKPTPMPAVKLSEAEIQQVRKRVEEFRSAVKGGTATNALQLTADEINALIATDQDLAPLKGKLYVVGIETNHVNARVSVLMDELGLGLPPLKGRYLNGEGTFSLSLKNGLIRLIAENISVKGKPVTEGYMQKIRTQNLAKNLNGNPRVSVATDSLQSIEVKDGKLVITPKQGPR